MFFTEFLKFDWVKIALKPCRVLAILALSVHFSLASTLCFDNKDFVVFIEIKCALNENVCAQVFLQKIDKKSRQSVVLQGERKFESLKFKQGMKEFIIRHNELLELEYNILKKTYPLSVCR